MLELSFLQSPKFNLGLTLQT